MFACSRLLSTRHSDNLESVVLKVNVYSLQLAPYLLDSTLDKMCLSLINLFVAIAVFAKK